MFEILRWFNGMEAVIDSKTGDAYFLRPFTAPKFVATDRKWKKADKPSIGLKFESGTDQYREAIL